MSMFDSTIGRRFWFIALLSSATLTLSACAPLILGGAAATTAVVATDRRSSGVQLDDQTIALKAQNQISQKLGETARINGMAYNGTLLLTGDVASNEAKSQATTIAQGIEKVTKVVNQLNVGPVAGLGTRTNDTWLTSKVKTALINTKYVPSGTIALTTDHSVVYLMGKVTQAESNYAANAAAGVSGITKVVKLFEMISREEAVRLSNPATSSPSKAPIDSSIPADNSASRLPDNAASSAVEAMPIK